MKKILFFIAITCLTNFVNAQWQFAGMGGKSIHCFTARGTTIFSGTTGNGVFYSENTDTIWVAVDSGLTAPYINAMATCGNNVFAGTGDGVFLLTNSDSSWVAVDSGLTSHNISAMTVIGSNIYAGCFQLFLSTNNGTNWTLNSTDNFDYLTALASNGSDLFAVSEWQSGSGGLSGVFKKASGDSTFTEILNFFAAKKLAVSDSNIFVCGYSNIIYKSNDGGTTWITETTDHSAGYYNVYSILINDTNVFVGLNNGKVFLSSFHDTSWTDISNGLPNEPISALLVSGSYLYAGTGYHSGVWKRSLSEIMGITELDKLNDIDIYPNPATDLLYIEFSPNSEIQILNIEGQIIKNLISAENNTTFDISAFARGMYFVKVKNENGIAVKKLVKE